MKEVILLNAKESIAKYGYYKISSCDAPHWNIHEHLALKALHQQRPDGYTITYEINWQVYDWTITSKQGTI